MQGVYWNEEDWQSLLKRLPSDWQEQAIRLKAWQRMRKVATIANLLRALLVYAACGYSFREVGVWATLVGIGSLSERAWRKRVERSQAWIQWLLGALIGSQQSPGWLPAGIGRILLLDGSRLKTPAGTGEDVKMHSTYNLRAGHLESVQVCDRHSAEGLFHVTLHKGDVIVTDAGYPLGSSIQQGLAEASLGSASTQRPPGTPGARRWPEDRSQAPGQASEVWDGESVHGLGLGSQAPRAF